MKIIITAPPKTGKSTLLKKLAYGVLPNPKGILTHEVVSEQGERTGFEVEFLEGENISKLLLADKLFLFKEGFQLGKYSVNREIVGVCTRYLKTLSATLRPILIDEIGRMQSCSEEYLDTVHALLCSQNFVVASLVYDDEEFARRFRDIPGVEYIELTLENRDSIGTYIHKKWLEYSSKNPQ